MSQRNPAVGSTGLSQHKAIPSWCRMGGCHKDLIRKKTIRFYCLVVSTYPSEKYESVGMMTFPTEWKNKKCSKPPTSLPLR